MKTKIIITILVMFCSYLQLHADNYKILQMNTNNIKIGTVLCHQGDTFSESEQIFWTNEKQAIKAMNVKTKVIKVFTAKSFKDYHARSVEEYKDYYLKNNRLSARDRKTPFSNFVQDLPDTIYVYDTFSIELSNQIDPLWSYYISYNSNGVKKWRTLMSTDKHFFLCRELFENDEGIDEFIISLYCCNRKVNVDSLIAADLKVVLLPLIIDP